MHPLDRGFTSRAGQDQLVLLGGCGVLGTLAFFWLLIPVSAPDPLAPMPPAIAQAPIEPAPIPDPARGNPALPRNQAEALARMEPCGAVIGFQRGEVREITFDRQVTEQALEALKLFLKLRRLGLSQTVVTDDDLKHLNGLTELQSLSLRDTKITDAGLEHLKDLTGLKTLDLGGTQITEEGLKVIEHLTNLETLDLDKTRVTEAGVRPLQQTLPQAQNQAMISPTVHLPSGSVFRSQSRAPGGRGSSVESGPCRRTTCSGWSNRYRRRE